MCGETLHDRPILRSFHEICAENTQFSSNNLNVNVQRGNLLFSVVLMHWQDRIQIFQHSVYS